MRSRGEKEREEVEHYRNEDLLRSMEESLTSQGGQRKQGTWKKSRK